LLNTRSSTRSTLDNDLSCGFGFDCVLQLVCTKIRDGDKRYVRLKVTFRGLHNYTQPFLVGASCSIRWHVFIGYYTSCNYLAWFRPTELTIQLTSISIFIIITLVCGAVCCNMAQEGDAAGRHVIIVDDLVQSGGTLIQCHKVLASLGAAHGNSFTHMLLHHVGCNQLLPHNTFEQPPDSAAIANV
jgi:hypothetical protein